MQFKKFKSLASTHIKKSILLLVISSISVFMLCSCGKNNSTSIETDVIEEDSASTETDATVETTNVSENTTEPTETPDKRSEENPESGEVDLTGYLVDYPLTLDGKVAYVTLPEDYNFYADAVIYDSTYADYLKDYNYLICYKSFEDAEAIDFKPQVQYTFDCTADVQWFRDNAETGYSGFNTFEVNELTRYDNGIISYEIVSKYEEFSEYRYIAEYEVDGHTFQITITNVSEDEATTLFDFFGNLDTPVVIQ